MRERLVDIDEYTFQNIFEVCPAGMALLDGDLHFRQINQVFCKLTGYSERELSGQTLNTLIQPDHSGEDHSIFKQLINGTIPVFSADKLYVRKNGEIFWCASQIKILKHTGGHFKYFLLTIEDISQRMITEKKLIESEGRLSAILRNNSTAILVIQPDNIIAMVNDEFCHMTGFTKEEIVGFNWIDVITSSDRDRLIELKKQKLLNPEKVPDKIEFSFYRRDGELRHGLLYTTRIESIGNIIASFIDITPIRNSEDAARRQADLLELAYDSIITRNMNMQITYWNKGAAVKYGWTSEEAHGKIIHELLNTVFPMPLEEIYSILAQKGFWEGELIQSVKNGSKIVVESRWQLQKDKDNQPQAVLEINKDITKRKNAEEALKVSEENFRALIENMGEGVGIMNDEEIFLFANPAAEKLFGVQKGELPGLCLIDFLKPEAIEQIKRETEKRSKGEISTYILTICPRDNTMKEILVTATPRFEGPDFTGTFGIFRDITENMNTEAALKENEARLNELNVTKDKFFSIIAHDLRNHFNAVLGLLNLLLEDYQRFDKERIEKMLRMLADHSKQTYSLLENLLMWASSQSGRIELNPTMLNLYNLVNENTVLYKEQSEHKKQELRNSVPDPSVVFADITTLNLVVRNLLSNAIKFTPEGGIITVSARQLNGYIEVSISDTGVGISENNLNSIFKIENKTSTPGTNKESGSGLGLILCREFVEKNGGKIWVESNIGKGSTFTFTLPLQF
jgi:PAS domain S-box-containing protein